MKRFLNLIGLALFSASVVACSTVEGFGEDVEEAGEEISETANNNK